MINPADASLAGSDSGILVGIIDIWIRLYIDSAFMEQGQLLAFA
jgi:hypothetical protein